MVLNYNLIYKLNITDFASPVLFSEYLCIWIGIGAGGVRTGNVVELRSGFDERRPLAAVFDRPASRIAGRSRIVVYTRSILRVRSELRLEELTEFNVNNLVRKERFGLVLAFVAETVGQGRAIARPWPSRKTAVLTLLFNSILQF